MPNPPLGLQRSITFPALTTGGSAVASGGGAVPRAAIGKNVVARIDGDRYGVFSVSEVDILALIHPPDAPGRGRSWEVVASVEGPGPIAVEGGAISVTVAIVVGTAATQTSYSGSISIVEAGTSGPVLLSIPLSASVTLTPPGISGTITWALDLFDPFGSVPTDQWNDLFTISADTIAPGPPGSIGGTYTPVASVNLSNVVFDYPNIYGTYSLPAAALPLGQELVVFVAASPLFTVPAGANGIAVFPVAGPDGLVLTQAQPGVELDFVAEPYSVR